MIWNRIKTTSCSKGTVDACLTQIQRKIQLRTLKRMRDDTNATSPQRSNWDQTNLDVGKVDAVEVREHLVDLSCVLEDGAGCLREVIQTGVASQRLGKCISWGYLREHKEGERKERQKYVFRYSGGETQTSL